MGRGRAIPGINDLATLRPDIAAQWDYEKNGALKPEDVTVGSNKKVWWKCARNHSWPTRVHKRTKGSNCPFCMGKRVLPGFNDLATLRPDIAAEWDYDKNGNLTPEQVTAHANKKVWWKCHLNHSWDATIAGRTHQGKRAKGQGCPYCAHKKVCPGFNDLATVTPSLLDSWDYERNANLNPCDLTPYTRRMVWWKCKNGHHWRTSAHDMQYGYGCPYCYPRKAALYRPRIVPSI